MSLTDGDKALGLLQDRLRLREWRHGGRFLTMSVTSKTRGDDEVDVEYDAQAKSYLDSVPGRVAALLEQSLMGLNSDTPNTITPKLTYCQCLLYLLPLARLQLLSNIKLMHCS